MTGTATAPVGRAAEVRPRHVDRSSSHSLIAVVTTAACGWSSATDRAVDGRATLDGPAPPIVGTTLDGDAFDLAAYAGRPVIVNFWGPSCVPCRDEFPLLIDKQAEHAATASPSSAS